MDESTIRVMKVLYERYHKLLEHITYLIDLRKVHSQSFKSSELWATLNEKLRTEVYYIDSFCRQCKNRCSVKTCSIVENFIKEEAY